MKTPAVKQPAETVYVCCRMNGNIYVPLPTTMSGTTNGCSTRAKEVLGLTPYRRKKQGIRIMPFKLQFVPNWIEVEDGDDVYEEELDR